MKTCQTCRFWANNFSPESNKADCSKISMYSGNTVAYIEAKTTDNSGLDAFLMTAKDFGCTLYEDKRQRKRLKVIQLRKRQQTRVKPQ